MLIIYRTNEGFAGDVVSLDMTTPAAAMDAYLAAQAETDLDYIEIASGELESALLGALIASVQGYGQAGRFYMAEVDGKMSLVDGGAV